METSDLARDVRAGNVSPTKQTSQEDTDDPQ